MRTGPKCILSTCKWPPADKPHLCDLDLPYSRLPTAISMQQGAPSA